MKIIKQSWSFEDEIDGQAILQKLERAGRTCYKSEDKITCDSAQKFVSVIKSKNHESVIEHASVSVRIITDRGVTHEIVRHRLASYSQESTRYCNYSKDKFGNEITVICPVEFIPVWDTTLDAAIAYPNPKLVAQFLGWIAAMEAAQAEYFGMISNGATPQLARSVLPNSLKTEIVMTANLREWRHFFKMRASSGAHPQLRTLAYDMLKGFKEKIPLIFDDLGSE